MDRNTGGNQTVPTVSPPRGYVLSGKIMLSGIVILFSIVLFILFLHLYVRWHVIRRHNRRRRRRNRLIFTAAEDRTPRPSPPRGLDKQVLSSLPVEIFSDEDDDVADAECAVCLGEFGEGEKVRVLPRCGHRFHIGCIDMWFCSHSSCPLCRSAVEAVTSLDPVAELDADPDPAEVSDPDPRNREARIEIPEEAESTSDGVQVKLPVYSRILLFRRFLIGDTRPVRTASSDLEGGEPVNRTSPPPPPPPPPPQ